MADLQQAIDLGRLHPALILLAVSTAGAVVPLAVLAMSSFIKLNIVFSILRNAIGGQNLPPASLVLTLSLVLTAQIMAPVWQETGSRLLALIPQEGAAKDSLKTKKFVSGADKDKSAMPAVLNPAKIADAFSPLEKFLLLNSNRRERAFFAVQACKTADPTAAAIEDSQKDASAEDPGGQSGSGRTMRGETIFTLIPAFILTEVSEAFSIGFMIYLPFLIVDLVVANILLSLGMMMINPATISLPVKLVLFVMCEGWLHLIQGLIQGYVH